MPDQSGRKKTRSQAPQLRPLIVSAARSRVREEVMMSAATSRELGRYVRWAAGAGDLTVEEAMILTLDRAIGELLAKDEAWRQARAQEVAESRTSAPAPAAGPAAPVVPASGPGSRSV